MSYINGLYTAIDHINAHYLAEIDLSIETRNILCDIVETFEEMIDDELDRMHDEYLKEQAL